MSGLRLCVRSLAPLSSMRGTPANSSSFKRAFAFSARSRSKSHLARLLISGASTPDLNGTPPPSRRIFCPSHLIVSPSMTMSEAHDTPRPAVKITGNNVNAATAAIENRTLVMSPVSLHLPQPEADLGHGTDNSCDDDGIYASIYHCACAFRSRRITFQRLLVREKQALAYRYSQKQLGDANQQRKRSNNSSQVGEKHYFHRLDERRSSVLWFYQNTPTDRGRINANHGLLSERPRRAAMSMQPSHWWTDQIILSVAFNRSSDNVHSPPRKPCIMRVSPKLRLPKILGPHGSNGEGFFQAVAVKRPNVDILQAIFLIQEVECATLSQSEHKKPVAIKSSDWRSIVDLCQPFQRRARKGIQIGLINFLHRTFNYRIHGETLATSEREGQHPFRSRSSRAKRITCFIRRTTKPCRWNGVDPTAADCLDLH